MNIQFSAETGQEERKKLIKRERKHPVGGYRVSKENET